ncbi:bifunctional AP2-ERF domain/AP2-coincident [Babesia duncani]|uniref:Bifunctional AP2-ERF domain/AP2-coincident n=1 Tax=Babesia duncani TaxID=323732 RepID=A0AAD9UNZ2_9APIC|nr:bifunctional AP2-ERF domain/AP2-coincident [Babesia duncani]
MDENSGISLHGDTQETAEGGIPESLYLETPNRSAIGEEMHQQPVGQDVAEPVDASAWSKGGFILDPESMFNGSDMAKFGGANLESNLSDPEQQQMQQQQQQQQQQLQQPEYMDQGYALDSYSMISGFSMMRDDAAADQNSQMDVPRRMLNKGRKNKDEANELVRRAKLLPKVMGVRYDANHQYWVATWYQNRKRMDRYFSVGRFGFEEARLLAIDCRKTAGKSLQGKSYGRPSYSGKDILKSRPFDLDQKQDYYGATDPKKTKDFNRLNVSKVALNYILSDLCNNCLPTILENNHMPGELYIHCYNKISDHLQMIITANQSEEIEKYLHLFQLCIQNRVLPSALQVQEQRAMITTLCQM